MSYINLVEVSRAVKIEHIVSSSTLLSYPKYECASFLEPSPQYSSGVGVVKLCESQSEVEGDKREHAPLIAELSIC